MNIRKYISPEVRLTIKKNIRLVRDWRRGNLSRFAKKQANETPFPFNIKITQPVHNSYLMENKIKNINKSGKSLKQVVIYPNEIFSFWHTIGRPSADNGYRKGRNIINGKLQEDFGGGLCQLAGILYHTSLVGGLKILERHNHSIDLYDEENRYTPLGADATVVYGYKDLRVLNTMSFPVKFNVVATNKIVVCKLLGQDEIPQKSIVFERNHNGKTVEVVTKKEGIEIARSVYRRKEDGV